MEINEYQKMAMTTLNPSLNKRDVLINSVMGLCGESGEAIDIVKKWMAHGHELDKEHFIKELGDIAWYLAEAATALDISLEDIFQANIEKLKKDIRKDFKPKNHLLASREIYNPLILQHLKLPEPSPSKISVWFGRPPAKEFGGI